MIAGIRELFGRQADWRRRRSTVILTWLALAVIVLLQAQPFTYGFRRSADEVAFLAAFGHGWHAIEDMAVSLAVFQGRLGLLVTTPLNAIGAHLSDGFVARWIFVLLHFGVLALFAAYFSIVSATNVTRALLVFLVALQTICRGDDYMPPIAYPLQNTLPFLALLAARCTILLARRRDGGQLLLWPARLVFLVAMLTTEFAFLLATALLAGEYGFALARRRRNGAAAREALRAALRQREFAYDVAIVALALFAYLAFRWLHPSSYVGNVIDAGLAIGRVVETTVRHVLAGTVFSRDVLDVTSLPPQALPMAALVGILSTGCLLVVLREVRDLPSPLLVALGSVLAIAYVTFPLAGNARQQVWCVDNGACGYLDSRISYLGFVVIVVCLCALVLRLLPGPRASMAAVAAMSVATGVIAATTYARNLRDGQDMIVDGWTWERAALLACYPDEQPVADRALLRLIDPEKRVRFHPGADKAHFWREYMSVVRRDGQCASDTAARRAELRRVLELGAVVFVGQTIQFRGKAANLYLGDGWSQPEPWGVWSDADRANLSFLTRVAPRIGELQLRLVFQPYIRPSVGQQTIAVSVNGRPVDTWTISKNMRDNGCCERTIPLGPELRLGQDVEITFHVLDPRNPADDREIVDRRRLGLFLQSMTLVAPADKGR
jgi:hypothetical protein